MNYWWRGREGMQGFLQLLRYMYLPCVCLLGIVFLLYCTMVVMEEMEGMGLGPGKSSVDDI